MVAAKGVLGEHHVEGGTLRNCNSNSGNKIFCKAKVVFVRDKDKLSYLGSRKGFLEGLILAR